MLSLGIYIAPARAGDDNGATEAQTLLDSVQFYRIKGQTADAIRICQYLINKKAVGSTTRLLVCRNLVTLYRAVGDVEATITAVKTIQSLTRNPAVIYQSKLQLAYLLIHTKDFYTAKPILKEAGNYFRQCKDYVALANVSATEACVLKSQDSLDAARAKLEQAWKSAQMARNNINADIPEIIDVECGILNNMADLHIYNGDYKQALAILQKTDTLFDKAKDFSKAVICITYGEICAGLGNNTAARKAYEQGLKLAEPGDYHVAKEAAYGGLARLLKEEGKYQEALAYTEQYITVSQRVLSDDNLRRLDYLKTQFVLEKKNKEIAEGEISLLRKSRELEAQQRQKIFLIAGGIILLVFGGLIYRNLRHKEHVLKSKIRVQDAERSVLEAEGIIKGERQERNRIARELHDNVVSELAVLKLNLEALCKSSPIPAQAQTIKNTVIHSADVLEKLRKVAHNIMPDDADLENLYDQLNIFMARLPDAGIKFSYQVIGNVPSIGWLKGNVILMMVRELVNNVIKHARASEALLQLNFFPGLLTITVEDNGVGLDSRIIMDPVTMGWKNIRENLQLLHGEVDIQSFEHEGTTVFIEIPI